MPTAVLYPNGTSDNSWTTQGESTAHECLDDNNGDTSYVEESTNGEYFHVTFPDMDAADGTAADDKEILSIDQVRVNVWGRVPARSGGDGELSVIILADGGNYTEAFDMNNYAYHQEHNGTARTVSPAGNAWTYQHISDLEVRIAKDNANSTPAVRVTHVNIEIVYTSGYGHKTLGIKPAKINSIDATNIQKVNGLSN